MINKSQFLAKPTGISLEKHCDNVKNIANILIKANNFAIEKYKNFFGVNLTPKIFFIIYIHDDGKTYITWAVACASDYVLFLKKEPLHNIMTANVRHEFYSVIMNNIDDISDIIAVGSHHGKLIISNSEEYRNKLETHKLNGITFYSYYKKIIAKIEDDYFKSDIDLIIESYKHNALRAKLQICDKTASFIEENESESEKVVPKKFNWKYPNNFDITKRPIQNILHNYNEIHDIYFIQSYAGSGKSLAAMLWADKMINKHKLAERVIMCLPSIFTTNGMGKQIDGSSVYHSKANINGDLYGIEVFLNKTFSKPITITTIDQILSSLTHTREYQYISTDNLYNSCVVIDEVDFYDEFVLHNIKKLISLLIPLNVKVLIMSATLPNKFIDFFKDNHNCSPILKDSTKLFNKKTKINSIISYDINKNSGLTNIFNNIKKHKKTIIYCNTVLSTKKMYNRLKNKGFRVILYNSHYKPEDKIKIETTILNNFGENPTENNYDIVVMSQIGELSINITCDYMISEICPFDRLVQRLGRLHRFTDDMGNIDILIPYLNDKQYPYPYIVGFEKGKILENEYLFNTKQIIGEYVGKDLTYNDFEIIVNYIYKDFNGIPNTEIKNNLNAYSDIIRRNYLLSTNIDTRINDEVIVDDENTSGNWKARNFALTEPIIIYPFNDNMSITKKEYRDILNKNTIQLSKNLTMRKYNESTFINVKIYIDGKDKIVKIINDISKYDNIEGLDISIYEKDDNINNQIL